MALPFEAIICVRCSNILKSPVKMDGCGHHCCRKCVITRDSPPTNGELCPKCEVQFKNILPVDDAVYDRISEYECKMGLGHPIIIMTALLTVMDSIPIPANIVVAYHQIVNCLQRSFLTKDRCPGLSILPETLIDRKSLQSFRDIGFFRELSNQKKIYAAIGKYAARLPSMSTEPKQEPKQAPSASSYPTDRINHLSIALDSRKFIEAMKWMQQLQKEMKMSKEESSGIFRGKRIVGSLGQGKYGNVYEVLNKTSKKASAIKIISINPRNIDEWRRTHF